MNLEGKTALVTGAGRGIGKGCALELARAGATLIVNDRPESPDLEATRDEIHGLGGRAEIIESDVFSREGCQRLVRDALRKSPRIDVLVSNPAYNVRCPFLEYDPNEFEKIVAGTLTAGFHMSQLVSRQMVEQGGGGKLLFISSVHAEMPFANSIAYGAAKVGVNQMARAISVELAPHRINVNVIEPGWIDTPGERLTFGEEALRAEAAQLPWGRLGSPADIGKAAVFLVSDDADYITGSVLAVDGGFRFKDMGAKQQIEPLDKLTNSSADNEE